MAKLLKHRMNPWIEAAPSLIGSPYRSPYGPKLETIREDPRAEDHHYFEYETREQKNGGFKRTTIMAAKH